MDLWDLPNALLLLKNDASFNFNTDVETMQMGTVTDLKICSDNFQASKNLHISPNELFNLKLLVKSLKSVYPNFPVFKVFRLLHQKSGKRLILPIETSKSNKKVNCEVEKKVKKKKRVRKKKNHKVLDDSSTIFESEVSDLKSSQNLANFENFQMWSEKYKPQSSEDIIGNTSSVTELKNWLNSWVKFSTEKGNTNRRSKRRNSDSSGDFCSDNESRDTNTFPLNTLIFIGPSGSGKTSTLYALCNELNINVIELNASSKRPGKRILLELQEATKSHQVKNTDCVTANNFFQKLNSKQEDKSKENEDINKKLSLLFIEDADIVFEDDDEGFISALSSLLISSKRPIVITSSDANCAHLQKFISQYKVLIFHNLPSSLLTPWLEIICLIEGLHVDRNELLKLSELNNGDVRKILLQLQFWTQSRGDPIKTKDKSQSQEMLCFSQSSRRVSTDIDVLCVDESSNLSWMSDIANEGQQSHKIHTSCLECFISYQEKGKSGFCLPYPLSLGSLWWNIPNIVRIKPTNHKIFNNAEIKMLEDNSEDNNVLCTGSEQVNTNKTNSIEVAALCDILDVIASADVLNKIIGSTTDYEPYYDYWQINPVTSLSIDEDMRYYNESKEVTFEIIQWLVENSIIKYKSISCTKIEESCYNHAIPVADEKR